MDISLHFKACVKAHKFDKAVCNAQNKISKCHKINQNSFTSKAQNVTSQVMNLYALLIENRQAYLNLNSYLKNKHHLNDNNRYEIDVSAENIISICCQFITELKRDITVADISPQHREHNKIVVFLINEYLKQVCRIYSEQKAIRVKAIIEHKKLSKLNLSLSNKMIKNNNEINFSSFKKNDNELDCLKIQEINEDGNVLSYCEEELLSPEDIQIFKSENEQLYNELSILTEEVKEIETKVIHITELQELFTQRVLEQNKNLEHIFTTVVGSTENVREANEHIRKAIQRNAGLRVWILFFLLVMSFTLIFLDWFNP